jgi:hypothetical protein
LGPWALGLLGPWALRLLGPWALGLLGPWALGLLGSWALGPLGSWALGLLGYFFYISNFNSIFLLGILAPLEQVHMADLEKAIEYIVTTEIITQDTLDQLRLSAAYQMLESLVRYLPLRRPMKDFLVALRDWPVRMEFKAVTGQHFQDKVGC